MKRVTMLMLAGGVLLAGVGVYGVRQLNGSSVGSVSNPQQSTAKPAAEQRIAVQNQYADFSYPAKFTLVNSEKPVTPVLQTYNFTKQQVGQWQITVQITRLASDSLSDDGGYNYRATNPKQYSKSIRQIGNNQVTVFSDQTSNTFATVGYIQQGTLGASIAMSGGTPSTTGQLQSDFDALFASWQWH